MGMILPQALLYAPSFVYLGCWCFQLELGREKGIQRKVGKIRNTEEINRVGIALAGVLIGILLESYVNPYVLELILK